MRDFEFRMADIDRILLEMEKRGQEYFDDTMRIGRVMDLLNRSRMQQGFEQQVVADAPQQIERKVGELVDWLVDADLRQWQDVTQHLAERRRQYQDRIVGDDAGRFHYDPDAAHRLGRARIAEGRRLLRPSARGAGARRRRAERRRGGGRGQRRGVGLGADRDDRRDDGRRRVTGIIMASVIAALGFFILPAKRERAKEEMRRKIGACATAAVDALHEQFAQEIRKSGDRIRESIAPYSRFVRAEGGQAPEPSTPS